MKLGLHPLEKVQTGFSCCYKKASSLQGRRSTGRCAPELPVDRREQVPSPPPDSLCCSPLAEPRRGPGKAEMRFAESQPRHPSTGYRRGVWSWEVGITGRMADFPPACNLHESRDWAEPFFSLHLEHSEWNVGIRNEDLRLRTGGIREVTS